jgi:exopolysaccharide biosynthesis glucuronosyltransferase PssD
MSADSGKKILLVASAGGHWVQLNRLKPAFAGHRCIYASTLSGCARQVPDAEFHLLPDASLWNKFKLLWLAAKVAWLILRLRPDVVVSTGAAPGFFAVLFGKKLGARTIWLDSIANPEVMSKSGQKVKPYADLWLTQWEHLAGPDGPQFTGAVL